MAIRTSFAYAEHSFSCRFIVTPANIHDSQMIPMLLDPQNQEYHVWADSAYSAYSGERFKDLLSLAEFEIRIHEKGSGNHPLSAAPLKRNSFKLEILARVEYVFGCFATSMGGKSATKIWP